MKTADLYIRVSTDEQADKGYSQRDQEERLKRYCHYSGIQVRHVIFEDFSAKSFKRPAWQNLLITLKKQPNKTQFVLFTKWDRFSRNAGDAYQMINILKHLNVEPQAIEQPLDLSIPENKIMLAVYLASPEVENDRRALNTFNGMRRAVKEGRLMGCAPKGYLNKITEDGRKYIAVDQTLAPIIKAAFEEIARGRYTVSDIWRKAVDDGLNCAQNSFWKMIHNPVYCGRILVKAYKDEPEQIVEGKHEAIVSVTTFNKIQELINGKSASRTTFVASDEIPLRGFLICPLCGRHLTASASKSKTGRRYHYYHCYKKCTFRHRADHTNELFVQQLSRYIVNTSAAEVFRKKVEREFAKPSAGNHKSEIQTLSAQVAEANEKIKKARESYLSGAFDEVDFKEVKLSNEKKVLHLEDRIFELLRNRETVDHNKMIDNILRLFNRLVEYYKFMGSEGKRDLLSSMYPEKIVFDGAEVRTPRINEVVARMYQINSGLDVKKERLSEKKSRQPLKVTPQGLLTQTKAKKGKIKNIDL
ncbi:DNA invertase Pin-like site-specific DNA recombinase [Mucilaginibacter gracilis]|uniref:DNA invertase Pin-like site-specific DNA recombinase n=1 Tax=Mucilaginibacter gracilis TaxID=423350 RepID=A0A495J3A7_9SPHI|nr:recombinase family protein [Mucilaginibacter gracilis]RKR83313.1 DNA invertase Pin-like site-specific DNA recombinase [Mucilaginibacter gracilis]